jgi:hypothetical protein
MGEGDRERSEAVERASDATDLLEEIKRVAFPFHHRFAVVPLPHGFCLGGRDG